MPARLIYTNYPNGGRVWKFMLLITNQEHNKLVEVMNFIFTEIINTPLNLQGFTQSFVDQQGVGFNRTIVADYDTIDKLSKLKGLESFKLLSYCEVGALTNFVGANPINHAIIVSPVVSDVGLDLTADKYVNADYQSVIASILVPYNIWCQQQMQLHTNWVQYKNTEQAIINGQLPAPLPLLSTIIMAGPVAETETAKEVPSESDDERYERRLHKERSSSFSWVSSGRSTAATNSDDDGYNSDYLPGDISGIRRNLSRHSLDDLKLKQAEELKLKEAEEKRRAAEELKLKEAEEKRRAAEALKLKQAEEQRIAEAKLKLEEAKKTEFIPVQDGSRVTSAIKTVNKPSLGNNAFMQLVGSESEAEDSSEDDEVAVIKVAPVVTTKPVVTTPKKKGTKAKKKPSGKKQVEPLVVKEVVPASTLPAVNKTPPMLSFSANAPVNKQLPLVPAPVVRPVATADALSVVMHKRATALYNKICSVEISEERALTMARLCLFYFVMSMQEQDIIDPNVNPARFVQKAALCIGQCMIAGVFLNVAVERLKRRNVPRLRA